MADPSLLGYDPMQTSGMSWMPFAGAAAGMAPYLGYSRLPQSTGQALAGMAGSLAQGQLAASKNLLLSQQAIGEEQKNRLLGAQLGLYGDLYGMLPSLLGGVTQPSGGAQRQPVPMAFRNGGQVVPDSGQSDQSNSPAPNVNPLGLFGALTGNKAMVDYAGQLQQYNPALQSQIAGAKANVTSPLSVDIANMRHAQTTGDQDSASFWAQKARVDAGIEHVASMSGTTTQVDPITGRVLYSFNPTKGTIFQNGSEALAPGAYGVAASLANAQGGGEQAGKTAYTPIKTVIPSGPAAGTEVTTLGKNVFPGLGVPGSAGQRTATATPGSPNGGVVTEL